MLSFCFFFGLYGHNKQLQAMSYKFVTMGLGYFVLEPLNIVVAELRDLPRTHIDQVVVVGGRGFFIARAAIAEFMAFDDPGIFEKPHGPIDRGN